MNEEIRPNERHEERAALYALGLLEPDETAAFEAELRANPELASLVHELEESAALLALEAPSLAPPPGLLDRVLDEIHREKIVGFPAPETVPGRGPRTPLWLGWAAAAALAVLAGKLAFDRAGLQRQLADLRSKDALDSIRIATLTSQLENGKVSVGAIAWNGDSKRGYLTVQKMPQLAPNQDYQLWVIDPKYPQPVDGGIVRVDEGGNAELTFTVQVPIRSIDKFAISLEKRGGVPKAEGPMVMLSN